MASMIASRACGTYGRIIAAVPGGTPSQGRRPSAAPSCADPTVLALLVLVTVTRSLAIPCVASKHGRAGRRRRDRRLRAGATALLARALRRPKRPARLGARLRRGRRAAGRGRVGRARGDALA